MAVEFLSETQIAEARAANHQKIQALLATVKDATEFDEATQADYDGLIAEDDRLKKLIPRAKALAALQNDLGAARQPIPATPRDAELEDKKYGFRDIKDFLLSVVNTTKTKQMDPRLRVLAAAGADEQSTVSDVYGGFTVPEIFLPQLLMVDPEQDPSANLVTRIPMASSTVKIPARVDKTHYNATESSSSVSGGITMRFKSETQAAASSRMQFEQVALESHTAMSLVYSTEELLQDSAVSMAAVLQQAMRQEWGSRMLYYKLRGSGVGEPEGILNSPALVSTTRTGSGNDIDGQDLINMMERAYRYNDCVWMASSSVMADLCEAEIGSGNHALWLPGSGDVSGRSVVPPGFSMAGATITGILLGRPIFFSEHCSTAASAGDLMLINWSQYLWGERGTEEFAESIHVRFAEFERAFRFVKRCDGRGWWRSAMTLKNDSGGAYTVSPFVTVAA